MSLKRVVVAGSDSGSPDDHVSPVFGRCGVFYVIDFSDDGVKSSTVVSNPAVDLPGSAGVLAADSVVKLGADAVVAGDFGTASTEVFYKSGVRQYIVRDATIKEAIDKMLSGEGVCVDCERIITSKRFGIGRKGMMPEIYRGKNSYVCRNCGCTMPKKEGAESMQCPNCKKMMD